MNFTEKLKQRVVVTFIQENGRSPTMTELNELMRTAGERYPLLESKGFSNVDAVKVSFHDPASAEDENQTRHAVMDDQSVFQSRILQLTDLLENLHRGFCGTASRIDRQLSALESRLDNLLLLRGESVPFVHGTEETFDLQDKVVLDETTATVDSGSVYLGKTSYSLISSDAFTLQNSIVSDKGVLSTATVGTLDNIKELDGSVWLTQANTSYLLGRVTLVLQANFYQEQTISDIRLALANLEVNHKTVITILWSRDGVSFASTSVQEAELYSGENVYSIGKESCRAIKILISKQAADDHIVATNQYSYIYSVDLLQFYSDQYSEAFQSQIVLGPYTFYDETDQEISFTKVGLQPCHVVPDGTAISYFVSTDGETWLGVSTVSESLELISFGNDDQSIESYLDELPRNALTTIVPVGQERVSDAFLNLYVAEADVSKVVRDSIELHRNLEKGNVIRNNVSGWSFQDGKISTVVYNASGTFQINLGSTQAVLNGVSVTGIVNVNTGYNTFETNDANWRSVDGIEDLGSEEEVRAADPLYPFNHRYLVEGVDYAGGFTGNKLYLNTLENFQYRLRYVVPELFHSIEDLSVYTVEELDGNLYFKVKVDRSFSDWQNELIDVQFRTADSVNRLYVKALLNTDNAILSPRIDSIRIGVI